MARLIEGKFVDKTIKPFNIEFNPDLTEIIFLDIECYVPKDDRYLSKASMKYNPNIKSHIVLGGVFERTFPLLKKSQRSEFWIWDKEGNVRDERAVLQEIYNFIKESWKLIEGKKDANPDLMLAGTGISKHDIPTLFVRSTRFIIDTPEALFETYFKPKIIDLTNVGIPFFEYEPKKYPFYPKTTEELASQLEVQIKGHKESGKTVWEYYDLGQYEKIQQRTSSEVDDILKLATSIISKLPKQ